MTKDLYRYAFTSEVPTEEVEASILLALFAVESLHGESQVRLDASHFLDGDRRSCIIDAGTPVGRDLNRLFVGFIRHEFGDDCFQVSRVDAQPQPAEVAA